MMMTQLMIRKNVLVVVAREVKPLDEVMVVRNITRTRLLLGFRQEQTPSSLLYPGGRGHLVL
jgi:hypothetical protein